MSLHVDSSRAREISSSDSAVQAWQHSFWRSFPEGGLPSLSKNQQNEIQSLHREKDPELFSAQLLHFAARREREGRHDVALLLYQNLSEFPAAPERERHLARDRAAILLGEGKIGNRAEFLLSRLFDEAMSPAPIAAMGVAGSAFKLGRALSLNIFRNAALGMGFARAGAGGFGLLTESAAFTVSAKGVSEALGQGQDWSAGALKREWFGATLLLGALKAGGAAGSQAGRGLASLAGKTPGYHLNQGLTLAARAMTPLGLYGGILLGHDMEAALGLRPEQNGATAMVDGLATLFHLSVGGRLAQQLGAEGLSRAATRLEWRIGNSPPKPLRFPDIFSPSPALAVAGRSGDRPLPPRDIHLTKPLQMSALSVEKAPTFGMAELNRVHTYAKEMAGSTNDLLRFFFQNYSELAEVRNQHQFLLLLSKTRVGWKTALLDTAISSLVVATRYADLQSHSSTYANWLTKLCFEESFRRFDPLAMDSLLSFLGKGGSVSELESRFKPLFPEAALSEGAPPTPSFWRGRERLFGHIGHLPLSPGSKGLLRRWAQATAAFPDSPLTASAYRLVDLLDYHLGVPGRAAQVDRVLQVAAQSPLALARVERLRLVLETGLDAFKPLKLEELSDPEALFHGLDHPWTFSESSRPSQSNAYLGTLAPLKILSEMKRLEAELMDPVSAQARRDHRNEVLERLFPDGVRPEHLSRETFATAFRQLGDPFSLGLAEALLRNEFALEILPDHAFQARAGEFSEVKVTESAFYYYPMKLMLLRMPELKNYSHDSSRNAFFELMGILTHEYRHHLDIDPQVRRTPTMHLYQEMSGHFTEYLWKAQHGDNKLFSIYTRDHSLGAAMRFHDFYEYAYGHWWNKNPQNEDTHRAARQGP